MKTVQEAVDWVIEDIKEVHKNHPTYHKHLTPSDGSIQGSINSVGRNCGLSILRITEAQMESVRQTYRDIGCTPYADIEAKPGQTVIPCKHCGKMLNSIETLTYHEKHCPLKK